MDLELIKQISKEENLNQNSNPNPELREENPPDNTSDDETASAEEILFEDKTGLKFNDICPKKMLVNNNIPIYIQAMGHVVPQQHHEAFYYKNALRIFSRLQQLL